ncbi:hypothetical protein CY34DRAFT_90339 [Suillus luteus UH-Slu-Lm8-n1]|uniref:Uncharacterized protein n=1 Tax=Suillus luteus UH-Slu-Lm8-n1 TaxID=930992 RepID=A0A0D0AL09_9AGAM|nr:hypothetical protein CY34DRAFT_90339 [Suillus luteus UH-Slu-Lm8-n1]
MQYVLENPFPALVANLLSSVTKVLISVLIAWDRNSKQFEAGEYLFPFKLSHFISQFRDLATTKFNIAWLVGMISHSRCSH